MENVRATSLGVVVTWAVRNAFVKRTALEEALTAVGIDVRVRKCRPATYLRRAVDQAFEDGIIRKIGEDGHIVSYAVVDERTSLAEGAWEGQQREAITLDKETGKIEFKDGVLATEVQAAMDTHEGGLLSADVGMVLKQVITNAGGIALRPQGGAYFVPQENAVVLDKVESALNSVVTGRATVRISRLGVMAGRREAQDLARAYIETVRQEVMAMRDELRVLLRDLVKARPSTFVHRTARLREMVKQMELYNNSLGIAFPNTKQFLEDTLVVVKRAYAACVAQRTAAKSERKAARS